MVEFDAKLSADNVSFLLHDATLERTTSGRGRADALPWRELARLDAGLFATDTLPLDGHKLHAHADWSSAEGKDFRHE